MIPVLAGRHVARGFSESAGWLLISDYREPAERYSTLYRQEYTRAAERKAALVHHLFLDYRNQSKCYEMSCFYGESWSISILLLLRWLSQTPRCPVPGFFLYHLLSTIFWIDGLT